MWHKPLNERAFDSLFKFVAKPADFLLFVMPFSVTAAVLGRYFYNEPLVAVFEITEYSLLWITFLAVPLVAWQNEHITIEIIDEFLSPEKRERIIPRMQGVGTVLSVVIMLTFGVMSLLTVISEYTRGTLMISTYRPPRWIIYSVLPVTSFLTVIALVAQRKRRHDGSDELREGAGQL